MLSYNVFVAIRKQGGSGMSIGSQIAIRRKQIGMTQQGLADKIGVSFQAVSSWEREEYLPELNKSYYEGIITNKTAAIVKLLDRCNNVSTMVTGFMPAKMIEYIEETEQTEQYVFPLLVNVKHEYDEYYNAAFLLKYKLLSVMETLKRTL